jgi:cell division septation protein DedD
MDKNTPETKKKALPKRAAPFLTIDNSNLFGWLMSCFIVCGCMFFLGVMVGRNSAPVQFDVDRIEEKLSNLQVSVLKQKDIERTENPAPEIPGTTDIQSLPDTIDDPEEPILYEDIIDQLKDKGNPPEIYEQYVPPVLTPKYTKSLPPKQKPGSEKIKKAPAPATEKETVKQAVKSEPPAKAQPVAVLKPEINPEIKPTPAEKSTAVVKPEKTTVKENISETEKNIPKTPGTSGQGFAIQVASLKDPAQAKILMNKFKEKGYPAFCQDSEVNGATWHRVRIGPYPERALADKDQSRLKAAGVDSLVISMD